ncbi:MAG: cryptochrome/photolyase family protein [Bacteroidia bacterium]|nr:cryptochrome/photolyase family protein [Bacteroidia bacterium]MCX7651545.1 cryptochrome/photolyase family protein [Bacteroidia bacterium]MDW8416259.1 cryptochrome/photolyase family protein [Bacteroidia bacterium]
MAILLVYPHQLFPPDKLPSEIREVWLVEEPLLFGDPIHAPVFHKQKLILHRASMRRYADELQGLGFTVEYWAYATLVRDGAPHASRYLMRYAAARGICAFHVFDPVDYLLERRLVRAAQQTGISIIFHDTPAFLTNRVENHYFHVHQRRYHQTDYYIWQRKRLGILLTAEGKPVGGRWTYDTENRKRLPRNAYPPSLPQCPPDSYVSEATGYVEKNFPHAWGASGPWWLPTSREGALQWLDAFLRERFYFFGPYEDAFEAQEPFLYHSVISPLLNIGLLTPDEVVRRTLAYAEKEEIPLPSLEGFLRQVIGWREYIRMVYDTAGTSLRKSNIWGHNSDFPAGWASAETGIAPVDMTLRRVFRWGYTHHIERLMVLGSFLFLHEVHPDRVYQFFMQSFIDAYDWVMVPNVYGMSQHASSLITTKPYFCGSRYLLSMSHYPKGAWCEAWDKLFWGWVAKHREQLSRYPRLLPLLRNAKVNQS